MAFTTFRLSGTVTPILNECARAFALAFLYLEQSKTGKVSIGRMSFADVRLLSLRLGRHEVPDSLPEVVRGGRFVKYGGAAEVGARVDPVKVPVTGGKLVEEPRAHQVAEREKVPGREPGRVAVSPHLRSHKQGPWPEKKGASDNGRHDSEKRAASRHFE